MSVRRTVITGLGVISPIGKDADAFWAALAAGKSGVRPVEYFDASELPSRIAGTIPDFDAKSYLEKKDRKQLRVMARPIQLAVAAAKVALDHTKIDKAKLDPTRFGVEFGAGLMPSELDEIAPASVASANCQPMTVDMKRWGEQGLPAITPLWMLKYLPNMHACHISVLHNAQGPNNTITESDVAPILAVCEAVRIIRRNHADFFLVGGTDAKVHPLSMVRQSLFGHLSRRNDAPERACRPFELDRDGVVLGEGAGVLAVEELSHAQNRGAKIWGEIVGFGSAFDRGFTGKGIARAIRAALQQANVTPADIDHVNAHGLGARDADAWEARGIHEVFGNDTPVWAIKSYTGSLAAGSPLVELAGSLLALQSGVLPPTLNYDKPDPACPVRVLREQRPVAKPYIVKLSATDLGQCAALVCKRWD